MIIDATPQAASPGQTSWCRMRTPKLSVSYRFGTTVRPPPMHPLDQALALFHAGHTTQTLPVIGQAACAGNARARYVFATALFNGDGIEQDWPAAYRLMQMAHEGGIAQAAESLAVMADLMADQEHRQSTAPTLLSAVATKKTVETLAQLRSPEPAPTSLAGVVRELTRPLLARRLEHLLPNAMERNVAAALRHPTAL